MPLPLVALVCIVSFLAGVLVCLIAEQWGK